MDTTRIVGGTPVQTLFCLPTCLDKSDLRLIQDPGAYKPSTAESLAPFHQDPTQRIVGLDMPFSFGYLFLRAGALLELESREGSVVTWDEWKGHVVTPCIPPMGFELDTLWVWVSGCRVFSVYSGDYGPNVRMEVYDFSVKGRTKYLSEQVNAELGGIRYLLPVWESGPTPREKLFDPPARDVEERVVLTRVSTTVLSYFLWE